MYAEVDTRGRLCIYDVDTHDADNLLQSLKTYVATSDRPVPNVVTKLIRQITQALTEK